MNRLTNAVVILFVAVVLMLGYAVHQLENQGLQIKMILHNESQNAVAARQLQLTILKVNATIEGDAVEELVATRNELCAILEHGPTRATALKQCAIPFKPPTIQVNGNGQIKNNNGLPKG